MSLHDDFETHGWVLVRNVIPEEDLARFHRAFAHLVPEIDYPRRPEDDGVVWEVTGTAAAVPALRRISRDPRLASLVAEALGCPRVQLLQDSLLYKPSREGGSVQWHQDHTYTGFLTPPRVASLRVALLAEDEAAGCMRVVDGSHRWGPLGDLSALSATRVDSLLPALSDEQRQAIAGARLLELAPGDVTIHHCLTLHGSGPNRSPAPRKTIILRMFDSACRLDASRLPEAARASFVTEPDGTLSRELFPLL